MAFDEIAAFIADARTVGAKGSDIPQGAFAVRWEQQLNIAVADPCTSESSSMAADEA
ncbi:hypothetical protein [Streptomyces sp. NPDC058272]|uniref:hypothetical protein n=1 Tax=Streptomyces sp. NPDC058272 TaxID=3346415 RepID=UPI0036E3344C